MRYLKSVVLLMFLFLSQLVEGQRYKEQISFNATGDQTMSLGRYRIGTAIRIECYISGGWAEDGGIYHIASDYGNAPRVTLRSESSISNRLSFYGYVDPNSNYYAFLYATWDNVSTNESYVNNVQFTIYSESSIDVNSLGTFSSATELETLLELNATSKNVGIGTTSPFSGTGNSGLHISKGIHSSLLIGDPLIGHGGIVQTSDGKQRVFIGANLYDDNTGGWSSFSPGKGSAGISIIADEGGWGTGIDLITSPSDGHYNQSMAIKGNGFVGIGTTNPGNRLSVKSASVGQDIMNGLNSDGVEIYELGTLSDNESYLQLNDKAGATMLLARTDLDRMYWLGNLGIGTTTPDEKLTVKGKIHTEEVRVDLSVPAPDYVFADNYNLPTLESLEKFIKSESHLPEIPSAKEMEANGIELGTMNMLLLKKIEELTLYTLQQEKEIENLKLRIKNSPSHKPMVSSQLPTANS